MTLRAQTMESDAHQDLISQLPNHIILHILAKAFPPSIDTNTLDLVRTCMLLSKRWSNLWASFPHIVFLDHRLHRNDDGETVPDFPRLVNSVLLRRDTSCVQSFYLSWWSESDEHVPHYLAMWMQYAVSHNVRDLFMDVDLNLKPFKLPRGLFTSRFLEELNLSITGLGDDGIGYVDLPESVHLGLLRKLRLDHFNIVPASLKTLLSGYPVLEDLSICECMVQDPDICSESLKELYVSQCRINGTRIRISGSSIRNLCMNGNDIDRLEVLLENLPSLVRACVQTDDYNGNNWSNKVPDLLKYVNPMFEGMSEKLFERQTFHNLKELELWGDLIIGNLPTVVHFLERSPNLELVKLEWQVLISLDPIHKKQQMKIFFGCPHLEEFLATFDMENDILAEWLSDFCDDKCSCFEE